MIEEDCLICLNTFTDCIHPCARDEHVYCQSCWKEWASTFLQALFPCPTCRGLCFQQELFRCNGFVITRNPREGIEEGITHVDLITMTHRNIHETFQSFRQVLIHHRPYEWMHGILIEEMQVRFTSSDGGPEYTVPKYIVLYAGRYEEDLDIISYYETTNEMDEEEYDEEEYDEEEYDEEEDNEEDEEEYEYEDYRIKSEFI